METVNISQLPYCLRDSPYCKELVGYCPTGNKQIDIPTKFIIFNLNIENDEQFFNAIDIFKFWNLNKLPIEVYNYLSNNPNINLYKCMGSYFFELQTFKNVLQQTGKSEAFKVIENFIYE